MTSPLTWQTGAHQTRTSPSLSRWARVALLDSPPRPRRGPSSQPRVASARARTPWGTGGQKEERHSSDKTSWSPSPPPPCPASRGRWVDGQMDTAGTGRWGLSPVSGGPGILMHPGLRAGPHQPHPCPSPVATGKPRGGRGACGQRPPPPAPGAGPRPLSRRALYQILERSAASSLFERKTLSVPHPTAPPSSGLPPVPVARLVALHTW